MKVDPTTFTARGHGGLELVLDHWGDPSGVPVFLLHGGGQNRHAWKGTARRLAESGHHVLVPDARGHGDSGWSPDGEYDMEHFAGDLVHLLAIVDRPPVVVGASMGGMSALVTQGDSEEQLFSSLVLVDVTPRMEPGGVRRIMEFMAGNPDGFESLEHASDIVAAYNPHRERPTSAEGLRKVLRYQNGRWRWRWDPRWIAGKIDGLADGTGEAAQRMERMEDDLRRAASRVTVPTMLVRGAESDLVSADSVREFLELVPHAEYIDVSATGHMVAGDDNDAFTHAVIEFLTTHHPPIGGENRQP